MGEFNVLVLGGTTEASALARLLADQPSVSAVLSYAGRTRAPVAQPIPVRVGGFGGADGLAGHLRQARVDALVDATHPFAAQMSFNAAKAADMTGVPLLALRRDGWTAGAGDDWRMVPDMAAAVAALGLAPRRVFLTVGQKELAPFLAAPWHDYVIRSVDPPDAAALPPRAVQLLARGPFGLEDELRLLSDHRIEVIVTKNSGGTATVAKLVAARQLGLPVIMVERPPVPPVQAVETAAAALDWIQAQRRLRGE